MSMTFLVKKVVGLVTDAEQRNKAIKFLESTDIKNITSSTLSISSDGIFKYCYTVPKKVEKCNSREPDKSELLGLIDKLQK